MSRSGYVDEMNDQWALIRYRGAVKSALRGKRGQAFLRDMIAALDALPEKRLTCSELETPDGEVCALGAVGLMRGMDMSDIDPVDAATVAHRFGIAECMAREIVYENDEMILGAGNVPERRFKWMRDWAQSNLSQ